MLKWFKAQPIKSLILPHCSGLRFAKQISCSQLNLTGRICELSLVMIHLFIPMMINGNEDTVSSQTCSETLMGLYLLHSLCWPRSSMLGKTWLRRTLRIWLLDVLFTLSILLFIAWRMLIFFACWPKTLTFLRLRMDFSLGLLRSLFTTLCRSNTNLWFSNLSISLRILWLLSSFREQTAFPLDSSVIYLTKLTLSFQEWLFDSKRT